MTDQEFWEEIKDLRVFTIASRMKKISEMFQSQVQEIYDTRKRNFRTSWFAIMALIRTEEQLDLKFLVEKNFFSPPAVSRTINKLEKLGMIEFNIKEDRRSKYITLTPKGKKAIDQVGSDLKDLAELEFFKQLEKDGEFLDKLDWVEEQLSKKTLMEKITR